MSWYNGNRSEWKEIIETVAGETGRSVEMVEKDTIQSVFLFQLSKEDLPFVFKGGTSLSKVYSLIERFSEDIDLSMSRKLTESERKRASRAIQSIAECVGLVLLNPDDIFSRYSYNKYVFACDSLFKGSPMEIIVENNFYLPVYPVGRNTIHSFVGQFCDQRGISIPIPFEAASTVMEVQSLERTFIDKVFAICDYRLQGLHDRVSRHLYDIAKLLPEIDLNSELTDLVKIVREDRMQSKNNPSAQPEYDIPSMLGEIINSGYYKADYVNVTQKLLYEEMPYEKAIDDGIAVIASSDVFAYK